MLNAVLKKSQKEASGLIQRNDRGTPTDIYGSENSNNSTNTDNPMEQWTSLFRNMEGILARESNHLVSSSDLIFDCVLFWSVKIGFCVLMSIAIDNLCSTIAL